MNFATRSYQPELLDNPEIPFADIRLNMQELDFINRWLGGHAITISGLKQCVKRNAAPLHICEIGCGGGDNLRALKHWCEKRSIPALFTGIDINPHCISFANQRPDNAGIRFICSDYKEVSFDEKPDVIFSSLFCHHFNDQALVQMLQWSHAQARSGFFINDLHRHPLAYHSIRWLTKLFSRSYMVKHDAPLSVSRGFRKREWQDYFRQAGLPNYSLQWKWAFRWLVTCKHKTA